MTATDEIESLIEAVAAGDRKAFQMLYAATSAKLYGVALRILHDRAEADDVLQEVFLRIWKNADRYVATGLSPMTWLITIARNLAIDRIRARRRPAEDVDVAAELPDGAPGPEAAVIAAGEAARISACLAELPAERAAAITGAYLDGVTYQDLATRFGVPLNTIRTWLRRSLMRLRECLDR